MGETKSGTSAQDGVRRIGRLKSILFGIVAIVLFFGLIEVGLYVAGVPSPVSISCVRFRSRRCWLIQGVSDVAPTSSATAVTTLIN